MPQIPFILVVRGLPGVEAAAHAAGAAFQHMAGTVNNAAGRMNNAFMGTSTQINSLPGLLQKVNHSVGQVADTAEARYGNLSRLSAPMMEVGGGVMAIGASLDYMGYRAVAAASQVQQVRAGFVTMLGGEGPADKMLEEIKKFDQISNYDFQSTAQSVQQALAMGFKAEEIPGLLRSVGNAVGASGGGTEEFQHAIMTLGEAKGMGTFGLRQVRMLAMGSKLPADEILKAQGIDLSQGPVNADTAINALLKGMQGGKFEGGMARAAATLPGQLTILEGSFFRLSAAIGQYLLPPVQIVVGGLTKLSNLFESLPGPIQAVIGYGTVLIGTVLFIGGGILLLAGMFAGAIVPILTLSGALGVAGVAGTVAGGGILAVAGALWTALVPVLLTVGGVILAFAAGLIVVAGVIWGLVKLTEYLAKKPYQKNVEAGDATDQKRLELANKERAKRGQKALTMAEFEGDPNADATDSSTPDAGSQLEALKAQLKSPATPNAITPPPAMPVMPTQTVALAAPAGGPQAAPGSGAMPSLSAVTQGMPSGAGPTTNIEELQDQIAAHHMQRTKDKAGAELSNELRLARREDAHTKAQEREVKHHESEMLKAQRQQEREAHKRTALHEAEEQAQSHIQAAQVKADAATRVAELRGQIQKGKGHAAANAAIRAEIARVQADASASAAEAEAAGRADQTGVAGIRARANAEAAAIAARGRQGAAAAGAGGTSTLNAFSFLQRGGRLSGLAGLTGAGGGGGAATSTGRAASGGGVLDIHVPAPTQTELPDGTIRLHWDDVLVKRSRMDEAFSAFGVI